MTKIFNLPDLGEGLPDAEISEWLVSTGDKVNVDQPLVSMETAKAVVEVPSPYEGVISKLYGEKGDIIKTDSPLIAFELAEEKNNDAIKEDAGTVVGNIKESGETIEDNFIIGSNATRQDRNIKARRHIRAYAKEKGVSLANVTPTGAGGQITLEDVNTVLYPLKDDFEQIKGVRRTMVRTMSESHKEVVPVSIFDDADIHTWGKEEDITVRLIQAICIASQKEPALNAWYDKHNVARKCFDTVHLGLATDTPDGLFVPVINHAETLSKKDLREKINDFKTRLQNRDLNPDELTGSSITLSNFGKFAGRYASPIIVPPSVAILGVGRLREKTVYTNNEVSSHKMIPLSLSFDHRAVTGGEATRFLGEVIASLEKASF